MGVVIEICVKYPGGRTRITVTDIKPTSCTAIASRQKAAACLATISTYLHCALPVAVSACIAVMCVCPLRMPATGRSVDKYPRTTYEYGNHVHICVYSYSIVDVIKQRNMVNSGVRGTKDKNLRSRCIGKLL